MADEAARAKDAAKIAPLSSSVATPMPPGPSLPRFLQTLGFILIPARFIDACRRRYGDIVTFSSLFDSRFVMVFDPEMVKQVFRGSPEGLRAGDANAVLGPVVGDRPVLLLDGAEHLRQRRLMLPPFHVERMRAYAEVVRDAADRSIDSWPVGEPVTLLVAGHETTATALAWAFELLLRNPPVLQRLKAALEAGRDDYLDAVVKETLRLRPVIMGIGRVVRGEPFEVGGYLIPPGVE